MKQEISKTFNSLYEIHITILIETIDEYSLSILFMRFKTLKVFSSELMTLTFNSLYEIHINVTTNNTFSIQTFNSLYEILLKKRDIEQIKQIVLSILFMRFNIVLEDF